MFYMPLSSTHIIGMVTVLSSRKSKKKNNNDEDYGSVLKKMNKRFIIYTGEKSGMERTDNTMKAIHHKLLKNS